MSDTERDAEIERRIAALDTIGTRRRWDDAVERELRRLYHIEYALQAARAAHEATKTALKRVSADASATKARLRNAESAYQALAEDYAEVNQWVCDAQIILDGMDVPFVGDVPTRLAWLRDRVNELRAQQSWRDEYPNQEQAQRESDIAMEAQREQIERGKAVSA